MYVITNMTIVVIVMMKVNTTVIAATSPVDNEFKSNFKKTHTQASVNLITD